MRFTINGYSILGVTLSFSYYTFILYREKVTCNKKSMKSTRKLDKLFSYNRNKLQYERYHYRGDTTRILPIIFPSSMKTNLPLGRIKIIVQTPQKDSVGSFDPPPSSKICIY